MNNIQMVDLVAQYQKIKNEIDAAIATVVNNASFINGSAVKSFQLNLEKYLDGTHVIPCANGTDALQIALMALDLKPGDEVITTPFTFAATSEVIALLHLVPKFVDVDENTYNIDVTKIEAAITPKSKVIIPVHLFGQCADMEPILAIAKKHNLYVIEDTAQAIGAEYTFSDGTVKKAGTMGDAAGTSFFPSKNLGCFGDGGAVFANNEELAKKIRIIANHGQTTTYYHDEIGINSRLDSIQAAVLDVKLKYLNDYTAARNKAAEYYDKAFANHSFISTPARFAKSTHVFHQYTLKATHFDREKFIAYLTDKNIPAKVYYPVPLHLQKAYNLNGYQKGDFPVTERLCDEVFSLPMHTELSNDQLQYITENVLQFFKQ